MCLVYVCSVCGVCVSAVWLCVWGECMVCICVFGVSVLLCGVRECVCVVCVVSFVFTFVWCVCSVCVYVVCVCCGVCVWCVWWVCVWVCVYEWVL